VLTSIAVSTTFWSNALARLHHAAGATEGSAIHTSFGLESFHGLHTHRADTLTSIAKVVNLMMSDMSPAMRQTTSAVA
jgi:hypothetical protein